MATVGYGGEPAGYVITFPGGAKVYQAGDTCVFSDMALIGEIYRSDVAILPIGDLFTMGLQRAGHAVRLLGVQHVIKVHVRCAHGDAGGARAGSSRSSVCNQHGVPAAAGGAPPPSDVARAAAGGARRPGPSADSGSG